MIMMQNNVKDNKSDPHKNRIKLMKKYNKYHANRKYEGTLYKIAELNEDFHQYRLSEMNTICANCLSTSFHRRRNTILMEYQHSTHVVQMENSNLIQIPNIQKYLKNIMIPIIKNFFSKIRPLNSLLSPASIVNHDKNKLPGYNPTYRIHGAVYTK